MLCPSRHASETLYSQTEPQSATLERQTSQILGHPMLHRQSEHTSAMNSSEPRANTSLPHQSCFSIEPPMPTTVPPDGELSLIQPILWTSKKPEPHCTRNGCTGNTTKPVTETTHGERKRPHGEQADHTAEYSDTRIRCSTATCETEYA